MHCDCSTADSDKVHALNFLKCMLKAEILQVMPMGCEGGGAQLPVIHTARGVMSCQSCSRSGSNN